MQLRSFALRRTASAITALSLLVLGSAVMGTAAGSAASATAPSGFLGTVSCASPTSCLALATNGSGLVEDWNGSIWKPEPSPPVPGRFVAHNVACPAISKCFVVGETDGTGSRSGATVARWNGASWKVAYFGPPDQGGGTTFSDSSLTSISCPTRSECLTVGQNVSGAFGFPPSVTSTAWLWNGKGWASQRGGGNLVSCLSAFSCLSTGYSTNSEGQSNWALLWKDGKWTSPSNEFEEPAYQVQTLSCSKLEQKCILGYLTDAGPPKAAWWAATSGFSSTESLPQPSGSTGSSTLQEAACISTVCTVVGNYFSQSHTPMPLAERWTGERWKVQQAPRRSGYFDDVSCPTVTWCMGVGWDQTKGSPLTAVWNGKWTRVPVGS